MTWPFYLYAGCQELAEHVVNQAKVRLRRRPKQRKTVSKDSSIKSCNYNTPSPKKVPPEGTPTIRPSLSNTDKSSLTTSEHSSPCKSPVKDLSRRLSESGKPSSNFPEIPRSPASLVQSPCKTVYFSERHSITPKDSGIPNVPPSSPDSNFARCHNYIQSLCDNKVSTIVTACMHAWWCSIIIIHRVRGS